MQHHTVFLPLLLVALSLIYGTDTYQLLSEEVNAMKNAKNALLRVKDYYKGFYDAMEVYLNVDLKHQLNQAGLVDKAMMEKRLIDDFLLPVDFIEEPLLLYDWLESSKRHRRLKSESKDKFPDAFIEFVQSKIGPAMSDAAKQGFNSSVRGAIDYINSDDK